MSAQPHFSDIVFDRALLQKAPLKDAIPSINVCAFILNSSDDFVGGSGSI